MTETINAEKAQSMELRKALELLKSTEKNYRIAVQALNEISTPSNGMADWKTQYKMKRDRASKALADLNYPHLRD